MSILGLFTVFQYRIDFPQVKRGLISNIIDFVNKVLCGFWIDPECKENEKKAGRRLRKSKYPKFLVYGLCSEISIITNKVIANRNI